MLFIMFSCLVVATYIVTPLLYAFGGSHDESVELANTVFKACDATVLLLGLAVINNYWSLHEHRTCVWIPLLATIDLIAFNSFVVTPIITNASLSVDSGVINSVSSASMTEIFAQWNAISASIHLVVSFCCAWLIYCGFQSYEEIYEKQ